MNYSDLPKDPRTILHRGAIQLLHEDDDVSYVGLKRVLDEQCFVSNLLIKSDGLPLSRSSGLKSWPILLTTNITREYVSVVSVLECRATPKVTDLCRYFVGDLIDILPNGYTYPNGVHDPAHLEGFLCDCPATAFLLALKGHGGYGSCWKCTVCPKKTTS